MTVRVRRSTRKRRTKVQGRLRRILRWLAAVVLLFAAATVVQVVALRFVDPPVTAFMAARQLEAWVQGEWRFRVDRSWHDLDAIAPSIPLAVIAAEDQRFADHSGFDFDAIAQALDHNARGGRIRGASTISQQVAKNLFLWQRRSWLRKGLEAWYTLLIELMWPKRRILEVYVNVAEFGDGIYGVQAAAQRFWSKDASQLTLAESARLAAVLPSPRRYDARQPGPYVRRRAAWIQQQIQQLGGEAYLRRLD